MLPTPSFSLLVHSPFLLLRLFHLSNLYSSCPVYSSPLRLLLRPYLLLSFSYYHVHTFPCRFSSHSSIYFPICWFSRLSFFIIWFLRSKSPPPRYNENSLQATNATRRLTTKALGRREKETPPILVPSGAFLSLLRLNVIFFHPSKFFQSFHFSHFSLSSLLQLPFSLLLF